MSFGGIALGARGERLTAAWYRAAGYHIVARNWTCPIGEIDLICRRDDTIVICEVKTRASDRFGLPAEAVGAVKQLKLRRLAATWLAGAKQTGRGAGEVRFDVASVIGNRVDVIEAAF